MNKNSDIEQVVGALGEAASESERRFARQFLRHFPSVDEEEGDADNRARMISSCFEFLHRHQPGELRVRVYNPTEKEHGWTTSHTVVEMLNDDMPFLVDSVVLALNRLDLGVHLIVHPVLRIMRDQSGHFLAMAADSDDDDVLTESLIHLRIDRQTSPDVLARVERRIRSALADVRVAVEDWKPMTRKALEIADELAESRSGLDSDELEETREFFKWLADDHFTFLGYREYEITDTEKGRALVPVHDSGLGLMRAEYRKSPERLLSELSGDSRGRTSGEIHPIIITKTNGRATVHRDGYMDYISILRFDDSGQVSGEKRIIGLFTSGAYIRRCQDTPLVRQKVGRVVGMSSLRPGSHGAKALLHILETLPRDELFQAGTGELLELSMGILDLQERAQTRLFVRRERFGRFYSCMVFIPRDRFNTENRRKVQSILKRALRGERLDFSVQVGESKLARMHIIVRPRPDRVVEFDADEIEERIKQAIRSWDDDLGEILIRQCGEEKGLELLHRFGNAFPLSYQSDVAPHVASFDVLTAAGLRRVDDLQMSLYKPRKRGQGILRFKLFKYDSPIPLSDVLPMLENLGMRIVSERPYELTPDDGNRIWIQDFDMQPPVAGPISLDAIRDKFQIAFEQTWRGRNENDGFNRLILLARLEWRQACMLRACAKFLQQTGSPFSQNYMEQTLAAWPLAARLLVEYFEARFDPGRRSESGSRRAAAHKQLERHCQELAESIDDPVLEEFLDDVYRQRASGDDGDNGQSVRKTILRMLDSVSSADQDRILRSFADTIRAMLRTNFFQRDPRGQHHEYMSFKFDSSLLPDLPRPRPFREVWVYSPRVEGVHLRGGKIARGGLRWSDRREDFRTEVLGLMKAQTVKNTMIVPVGAKGGFFVKCPPETDDRDELMAEVVYCYRAFINGLLDITDNLDGERVRPPREVVRHDDDDPYLVVAADKGTATFSDIANAISVEHGFWLGDAFASGGSNGYDHKKMAITAKGAWESVKRHFRELGLDSQSEPFDVVGIGDMSGDVFGNGMLLSRHIRLKAAFNHMHIFLDPDPDPETSYAERQRLFSLPRSSWSDYDPGLISDGGGVYSRQSKTIPLSAPVREWLGVEETELAPHVLIRAILHAPSDLLWNGGIGTYVKAGDESHSDVGDLANNSVRVNGADLGCRVVGEGGNLGLTQRGRIEFALAGGRINTDFIDNSAGVDCSDHEVNIKILLDLAVSAGRIDTKRRNEMLREMTDEVEALVLRSNYLQTQALSMMEALTSTRLGAEAHFITMLEHQGWIDRDLEDLPDDEQLRERVARGLGLMRPELALLFSFSKITLYQDLVASEVPEDPYLSRELEDYFPALLGEQFQDLMQEHRLKREIIATRVTNNLVNRMGAYFAMRIKEDTGASSATVAKAYTVAREIFEARTYWRELEQYDAKVSAEQQNREYLEIWNLMRQSTRRLITLPGGFAIDISSKVNRFGPGMLEFREALPEILADEERETLEQRRAELEKAGFASDLSGRLAALGWMYSALDIVDEARSLELGVVEVGRIYFRLLDELGLRWLRENIENLPVEKQWHAHARGNLRDELFSHHRLLARRILSEHREDEDPVAAWFERHADAADRIRTMLDEMRAISRPDFATMQVAIHGLGQLLSSTG
ncbi:MAG: NAD-glutamate dehydrogenase [Wenzhouxiangellaceae bacterium]|nr:NAD-glutamate dehydrogenase [Wenzhouxiangellaceae bacterium]